MVAETARLKRLLQKEGRKLGTATPTCGTVYPLVWESDEIPVLERSFPSDHGAVLIEFGWIKTKDP